jgi:hypothetical protein
MERKSIIATMATKQPHFASFKKKNLKNRIFNGNLCDQKKKL